MRLARIDTFVKDSKPAKINSMCAVFAESEIVGLLAQDIAPGDIVLGCVESICQRTAAFAQKLAPVNPKVFFSGGLAQFDVIKRSLARHLRSEGSSNRSIMSIHRSNRSCRIRYPQKETIIFT